MDKESNEELVWARMEDGDDVVHSSPARSHVRAEVRSGGFCS